MYQYITKMLLETAASQLKEESGKDGCVTQGFRHQCSAHPSCKKLHLLPAQDHTDVEEQEVEPRDAAGLLQPLSSCGQVGLKRETLFHAVGWGMG